MEVDFSGDVDELVDLLPRILYLSKVLLQISFPMSADRIVANMLELWRLSERPDSQGIGISAALPPMYPGLERPLLSDVFAAVLIPRVRTVEDLRTLVSSLDSLDIRDRPRLLGGFKTDDGELRLLFNGPWVSMKRADKAGFEEYASALEEALSAGRRWQHHAWMRASARSLSAILDEMLDRREESELIVKTIAQEVGLSPNLEDQLATIAFNRKEYAVALEIWRRVLPGWDADELVYDMQPIFSTRCAAVAAANLDKWDVAARLFGEAIERSADVSMRPWRVGLLGDRGYALWRSGDRKGSVGVFFQAVEALERMPNTPESFAEYAVQKLVGHTLAWLAVPDGPNAMPVPGMCSNLEPSEGIKQLPPSPTVQAWFLLYEMAQQADDDVVAAACLEKFRAAPFSFLRAIAARDELRRHLTSGSLEDIVRLATRAALEMEKSALRKEMPTQEPDPPGLTAQLREGSIAAFIRPALWSAIMRAKVLGLSMTQLLDRWRENSDSTQPYLSEELSLCETLSGMPVGELSRMLRDTREPGGRRALAAVLLLGRDDSSVQDAFYSHVTVMDATKDYECLQDSAAESFDALVRRDWLRFCDSPFMLRSPRLYVSGIRQACESGAQGWSAAARIILAGMPTTNLNVPESIRRRLEELASRVA